MESKILNYRIIVEPDVRTGSKKPCFSAVCPTLGIADSGDSAEEAITSLKHGIETWIEALVQDGEPVPVDTVENSMVVFTSIKAPAKLRLATA